jgi:chromosomal replication initiator protein
MQTFTNWVALPENRSAKLAVERLARGLGARRPWSNLNPLFLHGPAGTGKSHLVAALIAEATAQAPDLIVSVLAASDLRFQGEEAEDQAQRTAARRADLLVVEDLQHLLARSSETLVQLLDARRVRNRLTVCTASVGPAQLNRLPVRLTSRLASGLVVGLAVLSPASRLTFLRARARQRGLTLDRSLLEWLAEHVGGSGRQLEGALVRLEALARLNGGVRSVGELAEHFRVEADNGGPTVERIARHVGSYFRIEPDQLQGRHRSRNALLPRQIGMYLARQLTELSLRQIGAYFGGRDHSTVLHACRKVEQALDRDLTLSGAVRQLHADLA